MILYSSLRVATFSLKNIKIKLYCCKTEPPKFLSLNFYWSKLIMKVFLISFLCLVKDLTNIYEKLHLCDFSNSNLSMDKITELFSSKTNKKRTIRGLPWSFHKMLQNDEPHNHMPFNAQRIPKGRRRQPARPSESICVASLRKSAKRYFNSRRPRRLEGPIFLCTPSKRAPMQLK